MALKLNIIFMFVLPFLGITGFVGGTTTGDFSKVEGEHSVMNLLATNEPSNLAKAQLFPRDVLTLTFIETVCGVEPSTSSSAPGTAPVVTTSSGVPGPPVFTSSSATSISSGIPVPSTDIPVTSTNSSSPVPSSPIHSSTLVDPTPSSTPAIPSSFNNSVSSSSSFTQSSSSVTPSVSSVQPSSSVTPSSSPAQSFVTQPTSRPTSSGTTNVATTANTAGSAATETAPLPDGASRPGGPSTVVMILLTLVNVLVIIVG